MQRTDGFFPLVDNTALEPIEVLRTYKKQPYLEKRFNTQKSILEVAPVFLETPRRIEAMMFLYFIALMLISLIERRIRLEMQARNIDSLPMRPAGMLTKKPTWRTIKDSFHGSASGDNRTIRQGHSYRIERAERTTTTYPGTAESTDHDLYETL